MITYEIFNKYFKDIAHDFERDLSDITEVVIHGTGGGNSARGLINWMMKDGRPDEYRRGVALFHNLIDRNGDFYRIIPFDYWVYHSSSGKHDKKTVGIELINPDLNNEKEFTDKQYNTLINLIKDMKDGYNLERIVGHGYNGRTYSNKDKNCPGNFDWDKLALALNLKKIENECYEV